MNADKIIFLENLLRRVYQTTDHLEGDVITSSDIVDLLEKHNFFLGAEEVNDIMEQIGFVGKQIPNQADKVWLVTQSEVL